MTKSNECTEATDEQSQEYVDHSKDLPTEGRVRATTWFVNRLFDMLEKAEVDGISSIISWQPHGRCFVMRDTKKLQEILPRYFKVTKTSSFLRQLNIYGFTRIARGPDRGGYYHDMFLAGMRWLAQKITPVKVKGTGVRSKTRQEPSFWEMQYVGSSDTGEPQIVPSSLSLSRTMSVVSHDTLKEETVATRPLNYQDQQDEEDSASKAGPLVSPQQVQSASTVDIDDDIDQVLQMVGPRPFIQDFTFTSSHNISFFTQEPQPNVMIDIEFDHDEIFAEKNEAHQTPQPAAEGEVRGCVSDSDSQNLSERDMDFVMNDFLDAPVGLAFDAFLNSPEAVL